MVLHFKYLCDIMKAKKKIERRKIMEDIQKIRKSVSKVLKDYRKQKGLTQVDLAEKLGYSEKTIAQWEQCNSDVPLEIIIMLRNETKKSIDEIYGLACFEIDLDKLIEEYMKDEDALKHKKAMLKEDDTIPAEEYLKDEMKEYINTPYFINTRPSIVVKDGQVIQVIMNIENNACRIIQFLVKKGLIYDVTEVDQKLKSCFKIKKEFAMALVKRYQRDTSSDDVNKLELELAKLKNFKPKTIKEKEDRELRIDELEKDIYDATVEQCCGELWKEVLYQLYEIDNLPSIDNEQDNPNNKSAKEIYDECEEFQPLVEIQRREYYESI